MRVSVNLESVKCDSERQSLPAKEEEEDLSYCAHVLCHYIFLLSCMCPSELDRGSVE